MLGPHRGVSKTSPSLIAHSGHSDSGVGPPRADAYTPMNIYEPIECEVIDL